MSKDKIISKIINLFVDVYSDSKKDNVEELLKKLSEIESICKNYLEISKVVYDLKPEKLKKLEIFCGITSNDDNDFNFEGYLDSMELSDKEKDNLQHFERHLVLSCLQRNYIDDITKDVSIEVDNAKNKVTKIYSEFVGILGVFTALSFALMGSVQVFGNIMSNISHPNIDTVGYVLVVSGSYLIVIYLVIMVMFIGMKKIFDTGKKYNFDETFTNWFFVISVGLIFIGLLLVCS